MCPKFKVQKKKRNHKNKQAIRDYKNDQKDLGWGGVGDKLEKGKIKLYKLKKTNTFMSG